MNSECNRKYNTDFLELKKNKSFAKIRKYKYFIINGGKRWIKNLQNKVLKDQIQVWR